MIYIIFYHHILCFSYVPRFRIFKKIYCIASRPAAVKTSMEEDLHINDWQSALPSMAMTAAPWPQKTEITKPSKKNVKKHGGF